VIEITKNEKDELVTICDRLAKMKPLQENWKVKDDFKWENKRKPQKIDCRK